MFMETGAHIRLVLWKAAKAVERVDRASINAAGPGLTDFEIMEALLHKGPMLINEIGAKVLLSSGSMTAAINRLETAGLVRLRRDADDGRCFHVHLTTAGRALIQRAFRQHAKTLDGMAAVLSTDEQRELVRLLKKLGLHAEAMAVRGAG
jgi:MarR family 2-MHQ and catechol resistance regulon transcriptional repressor